VGFDVASWFFFHFAFGWYGTTGGFFIVPFLEFYVVFTVDVLSSMLVFDRFRFAAFDTGLIPNHSSILPALITAYICCINKSISP
jgi:hypothetical protein